MIVVVHHAGRDLTEPAIAQERLHLRTNNPPYRPDPLEFGVLRIRLSTEEPHGYGDSIAELWKVGRGFINLEGDVLPWPGALSELWNCPEPWCALPIIVHHAVNERNLGCVKFSDRFIAENPELWSSYPRNSVFDWKSLDGWPYHRLQPRLHHSHRPPALHMNPEHYLLISSPPTTR